MTDIFIWRGCDVSETGAREAIKRNRDFIDRAGALLEDESGLPPDTSLPSDPGTTACSALDVVSATWINIQNSGLGTLEPGTYNYRLIPVDTCTGRTCEPIELPPLTITTLGEQATLALTLGSPPTSCDAYMLQRDDLLVGPVIPATNTMQASFNMTVPVTPLDGSFVNGEDDSFDIVPGGASLQAGDLVAYYNPDPFPAAPKVVSVTNVSGPTVTFAPKLTGTAAPPPAAFFDVLQRTALYGSAPLLGMPLSSPGLIPPYQNGFPPHPFSTTVPGPSSPVAGLFGVPHFGDVVSFGSKTAIVMGVFPGNNGVPTTSPITQVALLPLGLLPPPLPVGFIQLVYRPDPAPGVHNGFGIFGTPTGSIPPDDSIDPTFIVAGNGVGARDPNFQPGRRVLYTVDQVAYPLVPVSIGVVDSVDISAYNDPLTSPGALNTPPGSPSTGDRYFIDETPTGAWFGQPGKIAEWNGAAWAFEDALCEVTLSYNKNLTPDGALPYASFPHNDPATLVGPLAPGNRYLVGASPTGLWVTALPGQIAVYDGANWSFEDSVADSIKPGPFGGPGAIPFPPAPGIPGELLTETGGYFFLPDGASQFLPTAVVNPTGTYQRLTRLTTQITQANLISVLETGEHQVRSGSVGEVATEAQVALDRMLTQGGYPDGLTAFRGRVKGPCPLTGNLSIVNKTFNDTLGGFTLPEAADRFFAVNEVARLGPGPLVDATRVRALRTLVCDSIANLKELTTELTTSGIAVARFQSVTTTLPPERCPPGQPNATSTNLVCKGLATPSSPMLSQEQARVFWAPDTRFSVNAKKLLTDRGLTQVEAQAALELSASGRVINVIELRNDDISDSGDLIGADAGDILDDERISVIDLGPVIPSQIAEILKRRGLGGKIRRPICTEPGQAAVVEDFETVALNILDLSLRHPNSFQICDVDAALAALPAEIRAAVGGVLSVVHTGLDQLEVFAQSLRDFLNDGQWADAKEFIGGILNAISSDPTLGCLFGAINAQAPNFGLPSIPMLEGLLAQMSAPINIRFNLLGIVMDAIRSVLCILLNALLSLIPADLSQAGDAVRHAIGCIPAIEDLTLPVELDLLLQCDLSKLSVLIDIINQVLAEINEILDFFSLGQGLFRNVQAINQACSSDENLAGLVRRAGEALGIPDVYGNVTNAASTASSAATSAASTAVSVLSGI